MPKIIELRPNKSLINSDFEKYQFSQVSPALSKITLTTDVYRLDLSPGRESWLEVRLFGLHNHLFKNPYDTSCWFIDKDFTIWRLSYSGSLVKVHTMKSLDVKLDALYNPSIGFISNKITVVSDGRSYLELLLMDEEDASNPKSFTLDDRGTVGVIYDVQYVERKCVLIITMCAVKEREQKKYTELTLLSYLWRDKGETSEGFEFLKKQITRVNGIVEYAFVEDNGNFLHSISQNDIIFEAPLSKPMEIKETTNEDNHDGDNDDAQIKIPKYCWSQDEDSITVWIKLPEKHSSNRAKVNVDSTYLSVIINEEALIEGDCSHRLDESLTTWKQERDTLQIDLVKYETGLMWGELIKGDTGGECLPNEALAAVIHSRLAHLCTDTEDDARKEGQPCIGFNMEQLEECDIEARDNLLQRVDLLTQKATHLARLGTSHRVIFIYKMRRGQAICLRYDQDACVWMTECGAAEPGEAHSATDNDDDDDWRIKHVYTFPGFGYVEASKTNKKFCVSPLNGSYVAIVEHTRHIFVYERPGVGARLGRQWIVDLDSDVPVMGAVATNNYLIVLAKDALYKLHINL